MLTYDWCYFLGYRFELPVFCSPLLVYHSMLPVLDLFPPMWRLALIGLTCSSLTVTLPVLVASWLCPCAGEVPCCLCIWWILWFWAYLTSPLTFVFWSLESALHCTSLPLLWSSNNWAGCITSKSGNIFLSQTGNQAEGSVGRQTKAVLVSWISFCLLWIKCVLRWVNKDIKLISVGSKRRVQKVDSWIEENMWKNVSYLDILSPF